MSRRLSIAVLVVLATLVVAWGFVPAALAGPAPKKKASAHKVEGRGKKKAPVGEAKGKAKGKGSSKVEAKGKGAPKAEGKGKGKGEPKAEARGKGKGGSGKAKDDAKAKRSRKGRVDDEGSLGELDKVHRVRAGDSIWTISRKYDVSASELRRLNGEKKLRMLHPGQLVLIKKGDPRKPEEVRPFLKDWGRLEDGEGYVIKRPDKNYGRPWAIALVRQAITDLHERFPDSADVFVGDFSGPIGGRIQHHLSHRTGRDVDLAYFLVGNPSINDFVEVTPETVDVEKSWQLVESFLRTGRVQFVFMDYGLQPLFRAHAEAQGYPPEDLDHLFQYPRDVHDREGLIRHVKGHADHLHVRFACPPDDGLCR